LRSPLLRLIKASVSVLEGPDGPSSAVVGNPSSFLGMLRAGLTVELVKFEKDDGNLGSLLLA
jgi:hypothetical protein